MVRADQSETVRKQVYDEVKKYFKNKGVVPGKHFEINTYKQNKYRKHWLIVASISHHADTSADFVWNADVYMWKYLNNAVKIPRYVISVIQDTTTSDQNFHIRLMSR